MATFKTVDPSAMVRLTNKRTPKQADPVLAEKIEALASGKAFTVTVDEGESVHGTKIALARAANKLRGLKLVFVKNDDNSFVVYASNPQEAGE